MAVAVICECNPFHNGHRYLFEKAAEYGEVVAIMSGSFTQRGEPAIADKFTRAQIALENGADLVIELPTVYAVAGARRFAEGGAAIAKSLKAVTHLAFGSECGDIALLERAAFAESDSAVGERLRELMRDGDYYPRAYERAVREILGDETADVLRSPNNILAAEYIRAIRGSDIKLLAIERIAVSHDSGETEGAFASSSHIRRLLAQGKREEAAAFSPRIPDETTKPDNLERALLYRLREMSAEDFAKLPEVSEGLENRLYSAVKSAVSVEEIISAVKSKRYTRSRIRRILACALLGITAGLQNRDATYARVLGMTGEGSALLSSCRFDVVTSAAKYLRNENPNAAFLEKDILATDLQALAYDAVRPCSADYLTKIIRINYAK